MLLTNKGALKNKNTLKNKIPNKTKNKIPIEHTAFYPYLKNYLEVMAIRQYSVETLKRRDNSLRRFIAWCDDRGLINPQDVSKATMQRYQKYLHYCLQANGNTLSPVTQNAYLAGIKQFFKWLSQENHILYNPAADLIFAKTPATLPVVLSVEEVENVMMQPELHHVKGLRDRTILEMFYSTGVRRSELCHLKLEDLSLSRKTIHVRRGKGNKDRLLPVGERAIHWLARYINDARPGLIKPSTNLCCS